MTTEQKYNRVIVSHTDMTLHMQLMHDEMKRHGGKV